MNTGSRYARDGFGNPVCMALRVRAPYVRDVTGNLCMFRGRDRIVVPLIADKYGLDTGRVNPTSNQYSRRRILRATHCEPNNWSRPIFGNLRHPVRIHH